MSDPRGRTGTCRTWAVQSACAEDLYHQCCGIVLHSQVDLVAVEALHGMASSSFTVWTTAFCLS